jgi:hypothetical protein
VELLHLAWHHRLRNEAPNLDFAWVVSSLLPERAMQVAAQCRKIARKYEKHGIPYALKYQDTRFARTAELLLGGTEHGLTCATFVLAVFRAVGVELLELENWPARPDDLEFQAFVTDQLLQELQRLRRKIAALRSVPGQEARAEGHEERARTLEHHIEQVEGELGCVRFRPAEVAGASHLEELPANFPNAERAAQQIEEALAKEH